MFGYLYRLDVRWIFAGRAIFGVDVGKERREMVAYSQKKPIRELSICDVVGQFMAW